MINNRLMGIAATLVASTLMLGCQARDPQPESAQLNADTVRQIREEYQTANPNARVGWVIATLPDERLAAVADIAVGDFQEGQPLTFIDTQRNVIGVGRVVTIVDNQLHVRYEQPAQGARAPQQGDLAIRLN